MIPNWDILYNWELWKTCRRNNLVFWRLSMRKHRATLYLFFFVIPVLLLLFASCSFTRSDLLGIATAQPDIHIIPNSTHSFSFGTVDVYAIAKQTFHIENEGARTLKIEKLYTSNTAIKEFVIDTTYTTSNLEPGETTTFDIYFKPSSDVPTGIDMLIESNDPDEGIYQFSISGTGTWSSGNPPMILVMQGPTSVSLGSAAYDFGPVHVGSSAFIDFTVMNDSSAYYDLAVTGISFKSGDVTQFNRIAPQLPSNVSPGTGIDFTVEFAPEEALTYTVEVEIFSDDPNYGSFTFYVNGMGNFEPDIRVLQGSVEVFDGDTVNYGTVFNGDFLTKDITIENAGNLLLNVSGLSIVDLNDPQVFSCTTLCPIQISPGGTAAIPIVFAPNSPPGSPLVADVELYSDDPDESPYTFKVEGVASDMPAPDINVINNETGTDIPSGSEGHDFTTVGVGTSMTATFKIENSGNADLNIYEIFVSGDTTEFHLANLPTLPTVILPGYSVLFDVTYIPSDTGIDVASVYIENDDPDTEESPYVFDLQARGAVTEVPDIQVKVGSKKIANNGIYYFNEDDDAVEYPGSIERTFTIENKGKADLSISGMLMVTGNADNFTADLLTPVTVKAGSKIDFSITFNPGKPITGLEERTARLQISNNDADENPYKIDLVGYVELY